MSSSPSTGDWRKLSEASLWLHESKNWQELATKSPLILHHVIGADLCCWNEVDGVINIPRVELTEGYEETVSTLMETLMEQLPEHPLLPGESAVADWPEVSQISDVVTQRKFEDSGLYREAFRHLDTRYQLIGQPFLSDDFTVLFSINRKNHDFDDRDRTLLSNLLGHYRIVCNRLQTDEALQDRLNLFENLANENNGIIKFSPEGKLLAINSKAEQLISFHFPEKKNDFLSQCRSFCLNSRGVKSNSYKLFSENRNLALELTYFSTFENSEITCVIKQAQQTGTNSPGFSHLTSRQREVLKWIAEGKSNADIAIILGLSQRTIEKHCEHIFEKLGVENRFAASILFQPV
ncbi:MAG: LuxR C-terminal-related transcriptional regulator [Verrucomicrobiales bacterium]|nr:LuxR C-terminal-related transcriptional regulator [Verrucomicrobiales bacterium]